MIPKDKTIQIASFDDTTVVGINSAMVDYKLAWNINGRLALDLVRCDDLIFEGVPFAFYYYSAGENYNVYNLVSLVNNNKVLYRFKPRIDYLFLIQNSLSADRQLRIMHSLRNIAGIGHAFVLEKDDNLRSVLEAVAHCEQRMIDKKKKQNDLNEIRRQMRERQAEGCGI